MLPVTTKILARFIWFDYRHFFNGSSLPFICYHITMFIYPIYLYIYMLVYQAIYLCACMRMFLSIFDLLLVCLSLLVFQIIHKAVPSTGSSTHIQCNSFFHCLHTHTHTKMCCNSICFIHFSLVLSPSLFVYLFCHRQLKFMMTAERIKCYFIWIFIKLY